MADKSSLSLSPFLSGNPSYRQWQVSVVRLHRVVVVHVRAAAAGADRWPRSATVHAVLLRCRVGSDGRRFTTWTTGRSRSVHDSRSLIYTLWWISDEMTENKWHAKKAASPSAVVTVSERAVNGVWSISNFRQPLCSQQLDIAENPGKRICPEFRVTRWVHDAIVYSYMQLQLYVVRVIMVAL